MSVFDQKRMKLRLFQNLSLCIVSDVKIVARKLLEGILCILGDTSISVAGARCVSSCTVNRVNLKKVQQANYASPKVSF
jgi:hypothetical protein